MATPTRKPQEVTQSDPGFQRWIAGFRDRAVSQGLRPDTLDRAFAGVTYDPDVIKLDQNQSEFTKTIWDYLDSAASDRRMGAGQDAFVPPTPPPGDPHPPAVGGKRAVGALLWRARHPQTFRSQNQHFSQHPPPP
ncbi:MAG: lytic murein transglycosylase, partial [Tateyamaria sp.]